MKFMYYVELGFIKNVKDFEGYVSYEKAENFNNETEAFKRFQTLKESCLENEYVELGKVEIENGYILDCETMLTYNPVWGEQ